MVNYSSIIKQPLPPGEVECQITIEGNTATLKGKFPLKIVRNATSYYMDGYQFSPAFKSHKWDGKKHFFNLHNLSIPAGLTHLVIEALKKHSPSGKITVVDNRHNHSLPIKKDSFDLHGIEFGKGVYDYQLSVVQAMIDNHQGVIKCATNAGKTCMSCAVVKYLGLPTLFLVERIILVHQAANVFSKFLQIPLEEIGIIGDGNFTIGKWITIATPESLGNRLSTESVKFMLNKWQVLIIDEAHHASSDTFYDVVSKIPAHYRFGMSGTPLDRSDGADLRLLAQTGPVIYEVSNKLLVERGISVPPEVEMIKITDPVISSNCSWTEVQKRGVVENPHLNNMVVKKAIECVDKGYQVLILVEQIKHGSIIESLLTSCGHSATLGNTVSYLTGKEDSETREQALKLFKEGVIRILIATSILDEGVDVPCIDVLILAAGGKSKIRLLQRVGRGLRSGKDKKRLLVVDFANFCHKWLTKHSLSRLKTYKNEECFMISSS